MVSVNIPRTNLAPGTYDFGPAPVADTDSQAVITVDRTIAKGLDSVNASVIVTIDVNQSDDNGSSWYHLAGSELVGGPTGNNPRRPGIGTVTVEFSPGTSRQVKATVTVVGGSVTVSGNLNTS